MQASLSTWTPPGGALGRILAETRARVGSDKPERRSDLEKAAAEARNSPPPPSFAAALRAGASIAVIAEVKRRSPSRGEINSALSASAQAEAYAAGGAAAISVLTEPLHFGGSLADLAEARAAVAVPLLRKDFVVERTQLLETRVAGASAVLLIARALPPAQLRDLVAEAVAVGVEPMIEVRSESELALALSTAAAVIGVNARDLETLVMDPALVVHLLPLVPADRVAVAESGVAGRADVEWAAARGADAVLVGSMLSAAPDATAAVRALLGVPRGRRDAH